MFDLIGFATLNGGTAGGAGGAVIEVYTDSQLSDALTADDNPAIVVVNGTIEFDNINVRSNKTIQGGEDPWIQGGRFNISNASNVIVTGIRMTDAWDDSINIQYSENVWIHRNTLESGFDGLCDIKHGSNYITVSWNHFRNHDKTMLIGHNDANISDRGKLKTTIHHNWFENCVERVPRVRFGEVHSFNNYISNTTNGVLAGEEAQIYQEKCYYDHPNRPYTYNTPPSGYIKDVESKFVDIITSNPVRRTDRPEGVLWEPSNYYQYIAQDPDDAKIDVMSYAGALPQVSLEISYPPNYSVFELGQTVNITVEADNGEVDLIANNNVVDTKSNAPYEFEIEAGSVDINDSIVNIKFDNNITDFSPVRNDITIVEDTDSQFVTGARDMAIQLGVSDTPADRSYISIRSTGALQEIDNSFTISMWLKGEPIGQRILSSYDNNYGVYIHGLSGGRIDFFIVSNLGNYQLRSSPSSGSGFIEEDTWHHFAWTFDGRWLKCFYDFQISNELEIEENISLYSESTWLLNKTHSSSVPGQLSYDDFRIYNYAVTNIEKLVQDNFIGELEIKARRNGVESNIVTINIVEELPTFTITATATTGGQVSGAGDYEENEEVTLTATPDSGYEFVGWEEDSSIVSTSNPYIFNAEEDRSLLAVFQQIEYQLTVTYTAGGTATGSGEYIAGSQVQLTATPNSGYNFVGWYRGGTLISTSNPYNYTTRGQADTVQARFELIPIPEFTITVIPSTGGTVSGGGTYEEGQAVTLSAMPQSGWTFVKWSNDATDNPYSFTASENITISAIFEEVNPEVPYIIVKGKFKIV